MTEEPIAPQPERNSRYRYYFADTLTGDLMLELPMTSVTYGRRIRRAGEFAGQLFTSGTFEGINLYEGTMPGRVSLYITRDGQPVWGGLVVTRDYSAKDQVISIGANSFEYYLYRRTIWHTYSYANTVDQYDVVRDIFDNMSEDYNTDHVVEDNVTPQPANADLHFFVPSGDSGKSQDTQTLLGGDLKMVGEFLEEFSNNLNGFEYYIDIGWDGVSQKFTKTLVLRDTPPSQVPQGETFSGDRPGLDTLYFQHPGNVIEISLSEDIDSAATRYFTVGSAPEGADVAPHGTFTNTPYLESGWALFDEVESSKHSNASTSTTLEKYARQDGRRQKPPLPTWSVQVNGSMDPEIGTYAPGDWCRILTEDVFLKQRLGFSGEADTGVVKRIGEYSVVVPDASQTPEIVTLTLMDEWNDEGQV